MEESIEQYGFYDPKLDLSSYYYPPMELLDNYAEIQVNTEDLEAKKLAIISIFKSCNIEIDYIKAIVGPTVTLLYKKHPSQLKFVLIDTNQLEFSMYNKIPAVFRNFSPLV